MTTIMDMGMTTVMGTTRKVEKDVPAGVVGPVRAADMTRATPNLAK